MLFATREFHTSKDMDFPNDYEDAFCFDESLGLATVADGVSSAIFSRQWADLLTRSVIEMPPDLYTEGVFQQWLADLRAKWIEQIDLHNLPWNQRQKLQMVGGAFSTLLWLELYPWQVVDGELADDEPVDDATQKFRMRCFAVGDCSLFHVRNGEILRSFPLNTAAEFDADPISICSVNLNRDHELAFQAIDDACLENDLLVLCSDAIGKWAMTCMEDDNPPDWESYWDKSFEDWIQEIVSLRQNKLMRYDDTTLLLLRVGSNVEAVSLADESRPDEHDSVSIEDTVSDTTEVALDDWESRIPVDDDSQVDPPRDPDDTVLEEYDATMLAEPVGDRQSNVPEAADWQLADTVEFAAVIPEATLPETVDEDSSRGADQEIEDDSNSDATTIAEDSSLMDSVEPDSPTDSDPDSDGSTDSRK